MATEFCSIHGDVDSADCSDDPEWGRIHNIDPLHTLEGYPIGDPIPVPDPSHESDALGPPPIPGSEDEAPEVPTF